MPKLSRTQKFADLRDQMANDKEASVSTQELSQFENRLNSFNGYNAQNARPVQDSRYVWTPFPGEMPEEPVYENPQAPTESQPYAQPTIEQPITEMPVYQQPVRETPTYAEPVVEKPIYTEPQQQAPVYQAPQQSNPQPYVQPAPVQQPEPPVQQPIDNESSYFKYFNNLIDDTMNINNEASYETYFKETKTEQTVERPAYSQQPVQQNPQPIQQTAQMNTSQFSNPVLDADDDFVNNDYLYNTLNEINIYNQNKGMQTIDQITNNMVDEVMHSESRQTQNVAANTNFTNTVTTDINKIMDDIVVTRETPVQQQPQYFSPNAYQQQPVEEHPVLAKTLEQEKTEPIVEIRNLKDIDGATMKDTISGTIPFVVANKGEEVEEDDEGSNTVLNVILIILIVILVAVLGLIVFYILKTRGII